MYKEQFNSLSQKIRTVSCDWLFSNIYNSDGKDKVKIYSEAYVHLSLILTVMDWNEEGTKSDVMELILPQMNPLPTELKQLNQKIFSL